MPSTSRGYRYPASSAAPNVPLDMSNLAADLNADVTAIAGNMLGMTSYTSTWSASVTPPSLGNGTLVAAWAKAGILTFVRLLLTFGSTTSAGSGRWAFTLPTAPNSDQTMSALIADASASARYGGSAWLTNGNHVLAVATGAGGDFGASSTSPMTWANGDKLIVTGFYQ